MAHYFKLQARYFELQEKEGVERAHEIFSVSKSEILAFQEKMETDGKSDESRSTLGDMIDRYAFVKYPWNADINLYMDVVLSGKPLFLDFNFAVPSGLQSSLKPYLYLLTVHYRVVSARTND